MSLRSLACPVAFLALSALVPASAAASVQAPAPRPAAPAVQPASPQPPPPPPPAPPPAPEPRELANVRIAVAIRAAGDPPYAKTFTVTVGDRGNARIRGDQRGGGARFLHVDASPRIIEGRIRLSLVFEHNLPDFSEPASDRSNNVLTENLDVVLDNGKPLVVAEHQDAGSGRPITVEVTATILK